MSYKQMTYMIKFVNFTLGAPFQTT